MSVVLHFKSVCPYHTYRKDNKYVISIYHYIYKRFAFIGSNKINGQMNARGRPRIPTPDVQKDGIIDKDNKQNVSVNGSVQSGTYSTDVPVVQVMY